MSDIAALVATMQEWSETSGDHYWLAAITLREQAAEIERLHGEYAEKWAEANGWKAFAEITQAQLATTRALLQELHAMVLGECPSLLQEDSGGCADIDIRITDALEKRAQAKHGESNG